MPPPFTDTRAVGTASRSAPFESCRRRWARAWRCVFGRENRIGGRPCPLPELARLIRPLFWDAELKVSDLTEHTSWILGRVLSFGSATTVAAVRAFFGDEAIRDAVRQRGVDVRTRNYWNLILDEADAS